MLRKGLGKGGRTIRVEIKACVHMWVLKWQRDMCRWSSKEIKKVLLCYEVSVVVRTKKDVFSRVFFDVKGHDWPWWEADCLVGRDVVVFRLLLRLINLWGMWWTLVAWRTQGTGSKQAGVAMRASFETHRAMPRALEKRKMVARLTRTVEAVLSCKCNLRVGDIENDAMNRVPMMACVEGMDLARTVPARRCWQGFDATGFVVVDWNEGGIASRWIADEAVEQINRLATPLVDWKEVILLIHQS